MQTVTIQNYTSISVLLVQCGTNMIFFFSSISVLHHCIAITVIYQLQFVKMRVTHFSTLTFFTLDLALDLTDVVLQIVAWRTTAMDSNTLLSSIAAMDMDIDLLLVGNLCLDGRELAVHIPITMAFWMTSSSVEPSIYIIGSEEIKLILYM